MNKPITVKNKNSLRWMTIGFLISVFYTLILLPKEKYMALVREDGPLENLTALFFLFIAGAFFLLFLHERWLRDTDLQTRFSSKARRYVFLVLAGLFFIGFGEEISWGQRIFGFATPESLAELNIQDELNIHNLEFFNATDAEGSNRGGLKKLFSAKQLFLYCFTLYLLIIPLLNKKSDRMKRLFRRFFIPVSSLWLGVFFVSNYLLYRGLRLAVAPLVDEVFRNGLTEVQEFNFSLILLLLPLEWMKTSKRK